MPYAIDVLGEYVGWRYGTLGGIAVLLLTAGHRFHNRVCTGIGAAVLALLMIQP